MARLARLALPMIAVLLIAAAGAADSVRIVAERAEVRQEANAGASVVGTVDKGTVLQVIGREGGWVRVAYPLASGAFYAGYVPAVFCEDARAAAPSAGGPDQRASVGLPAAASTPTAQNPGASPPSLTAQPSECVRVFVTTVGELQGGFFDKAQADSRKDLAEKIGQERRNVCLADSRAEAQLMVVIGGRGLAGSGVYMPGSSTTTAYATGPNTAAAYTTTTPGMQIYVGNVQAALFLAKDGRPLATLAGQGMTWKGAANAIAKQLDAWVGLNQTAIARVLGLDDRTTPTTIMLQATPGFRARHPDLTPEMEKLIVDLGDSKQIDTGSMTPEEYLEKLYQAVLAARPAR